MDISFADVNDPNFDGRTYLKVLIAITKSDRGNGKPEIDFSVGDAQMKMFRDAGCRAR